MSEHDESLRELGTQLPWDRPDAARRDAVRSSLLVAAAEDNARPTTRWYVIGGAFAAGALAAAAAVLLFVRSADRTAPVASAARIEASPAAQYQRQVTRTPTGVDEVVRLRGGSLTLAVGALRAGDHVRVATRDAEVEGEGNYTVAVSGDELQEVKVTDGRATIRMTGQQAVFLSTGQAWRADAVIAHADMTAAPAAQVDTAPPSPQVDTAPPSPQVDVPAPPIAQPNAPTLAPGPAASPPVIAAPRRAPHIVPGAPPASAAVHAAEPLPSVDEPKSAAPIVEGAQSKAPEPPAPAVTSPAPAIAPPPPGKEVERRFQAGMALLKAGKAADAARELTAAADAGGDDPLAADARYFAATALTKAGRKTEAERALVAFIDRAPSSIRRGRAAVMLARLIAERGDSTAARAWFESALGDADPSVVAAAKAGIASLH